MEKSAHHAVSSRLLTGSRIVFISAAICALFLGYFGLEIWIKQLPPGEYGLGLWNVIYYDLQLFVLGSDPLQSPGPYPVLLNVARFAAPAATVYAVFEAGRALFAGEFRRWRNRRRRGHAIVVGNTTVARALADQLAVGGRGRKSRRVFTIPEFAPDSLRAAGISGAAVVYACADDTFDSTVNVAIAQAAATARRKRWRPPALKVYAQVSSATLALGLRARWLGQSPRDKLDLDYFNVEELAARAALRPGDLQIGADREPHILLAGLGTFGQALLVAYAQQWPLESGRPHDRVTVTVVGAGQAEVNQLVAQWQCVQDVCDVRAMAGDLDAALTTLDGVLPHRTYICYEDENEALFAALTVARLWRGGRDSVVVRLNRLARHDTFSQPNNESPGTGLSATSKSEAEAAAPMVPPALGSRLRSRSLAGVSQLNLLDQVGGRLRLVSVTAEACKPEVIGVDLVERLAQSIHHQYLLERVRKGEDPGQRASLTPWEGLTEAFREANRAPARDIGRKLSRIHATVAPRTGFNDTFSFTPAEEEELAMHEHDRWWAQRLAAGWRHGPDVDYERKRHPSVTEWANLSEMEQVKDREAVQGIPRVLADVGLEIVRLSEPVLPAVQPERDSLQGSDGGMDSVLEPAGGSASA